MEGQDKMSLEDLKYELESACERNEKSTMISLLNSILKKAFGQQKIEFRKQLVQLYREGNNKTEFMELAPNVLKHDAANIDLRLHLVKMLLANPSLYYQAQTEMQRLDS